MLIHIEAMKTHIRRFRCKLLLQNKIADSEICRAQTDTETDAQPMANSLAATSNPTSCPGAAKMVFVYYMCTKNQLSSRSCQKYSKPMQRQERYYPIPGYTATRVVHSLFSAHIVNVRKAGQTQANKPATKPASRLTKQTQEQARKHTRRKQAGWQQSDKQTNWQKSWQEQARKHTRRKQAGWQQSDKQTNWQKSWQTHTDPHANANGHTHTHR